MTKAIPLSSIPSQASIDLLRIVGVCFKCPAPIYKILFGQSLKKKKQIFITNASHLAFKEVTIF